MNDNDSFQLIDEDNNVFNEIEEELEDDNKLMNTFVLGLPDWDLEPLYETMKRRDD